MNAFTGQGTSAGKKVLFWLAVLAMILACVPATPTPIPTLNPNDINLFIQQTSDAAAIQTMTAVPTFTQTATPTSTPRNTFTPEPTQTPFVTFVLPSPAPEFALKYYRVKHDTQLGIYDHRSRTKMPDWPLNPQTPEVVPLFLDAKLSSGTTRTVVDGPWEYYIDALNGFDQGKLRYLKADNSALFNRAGFPQLESLTMGGNIVSLEQVRDGWGKVHTMSYAQVGSAETDNYRTRPDLVHKFVVVVWNQKTKSTYWINPPKGDTYWPLVASRPVWIEMSRVEPFPNLPMEVTAKVEQEIRREPGTDGDPTGQRLAVGDSVTITQYKPIASQVWGRLQNGRWIALFLYQNTGPTYFTSWKMQTLPPPP